MTVGWINDIAERVARHGAVVRVTVIEADGSAPRDVGAAMNVTTGDFTGTIGGGALENEALMVSRKMLADGNNQPWDRQVRDYPLGPELAQCCGGYVRLMYEVYTENEIADFDAELDDSGQRIAVRPIAAGQPVRIIADRKSDDDDWPLALRREIRQMMSGAVPCQATLIAGDVQWYLDPLAADHVPLYLYGAGHVGRAVVHVLKDLPFQIHWVDTSAERYPEIIPGGVRQVITDDPAGVPANAEADAFHVIMTFSHVIDFDICRAVLGGDNFAYLGLIGSRTKRARFVKRLGEAGFNDRSIGRLHSPIGTPGLDGKEPAVIAVSLAADLLVRLLEHARSSKSDTGAIQGGVS